MWSVEIIEVLKRWVSDDCPDSTSDLLITLVEDAHAVVNSHVPNLDARVLIEGDLQRLLAIQISKMVQRAWTADYTSYTSQSYNRGAFSEGYSKSDSTEQGVFMEASEIAKLSKTGRVVSISTDPNQANFRLGW